MTLAITSIEYLLANLLFCFDWRLRTFIVQGEDLDTTEVNALKAFRKNSLYILRSSYVTI